MNQIRYLMMAWIRFIHCHRRGGYARDGISPHRRLRQVPAVPRPYFCQRFCQARSV